MSRSRSFTRSGRCSPGSPRRIGKRPPPTRQRSTADIVQPSAWTDLREGIVHIWNTPSLLAIVWLALLFNFTAFPLTNGLLPYVAKEIYRIDQAGLGYLVASLGFGALLGALVMTWFGSEVRLSRLMFIAAVIWHILMLIFIQMQSLTAAASSCCFLCGVAQSLTMVCHTVLLLRTSTQRFRGRVLGVRMLAIYSLPLGLLIAGASIERIGFRWTASLFAGTGLLFTDRDRGEVAQKSVTSGDGGNGIANAARLVTRVCRV